MATLYVENVPDPLYKALRKRAQDHRKSIAAEVIALLEQNVPTEDQIRKRQKVLRALARLRMTPAPQPGPFASAEAMIREDRER
ncbi:MAG: hypothetical protein WCA16_17170 [Candidatus Sulfotelmatobacter sp.]